jgi:hypothetical protein
MFPDTAQFTDPAYTNLEGTDPLSLVNPNDWSGEVSPTPGAGAGSEATVSSQSGAPVSGQSGSSLLGWLGLSNNIAQTVVAATRGSTPTARRPGTLTQSVTATGSMTLIIIALVFIGAIFVLRKA